MGGVAAMKGAVVEGQVLVRIAEEGADTERLAELSNALCADLLALDVDDVTPVSAGAPPSGARGVDVQTVDALLVTGRAVVDLLGPLISAVRSWMDRHGDATPRTVELTVGDKTLKVTDATPDQQDRLVMEFLRALARD